MYLENLKVGDRLIYVGPYNDCKCNPEGAYVVEVTNVRGIYDNTFRGKVIDVIIPCGVNMIFKGFYCKSFTMDENCWKHLTPKKFRLW